MTFLRANLAWVVLILGIFAVAGIQLFGTTQANTPILLDPRSAQPNGALGLTMWLRQLGYHVTDGDFSAPPGRGSGTLFLLEPQADPGRAADRQLLNWTRHGGQLVIVSDTDVEPLLSGFGWSIVPALDGPIRVSSPLLLAPPTARLSGRSSAVLSPGFPGVAVAESAFGATLVQERMGRGTARLLTAPSLLTNAGIGHGENRLLALNLAGPKGGRVGLESVAPTAVSGTPTGNWLMDSAWGAAALFVTLVAVLYRWLAGRRLGPPLHVEALHYRPGIEYVYAMAGLLRRGRKREEAIRPYRRSLERELRRVGGPEHLSPALAKRAASVLEPRDRITERELVATARAIVEIEREIGSTNDRG